jgi:crotonobetaine/carnitine-CoA ligase
MTKLPDLHPFLGQDVWQLVEERAVLSADETFLTWQPFDGPARSWTYADFAREARAVAAGLQQRGVGAGDRVVIHLENCPEFLLAWFGCAALHAIAVTTNARAAEDELRYFIEDSDAVAAITQPRFLGVVTAAGPKLELVACLDADPGLADEGEAGDAGDASAAGSAGPVMDGVLRFDELKVADSDLALPAADPAAPLSIQYTSGTTARPKGVLWTHANGLWAGRVNALHEGLRADDCHLTYMPLFHTNALAYSVLASLWVGGRVVLLHKWSTSRFWDISVAHRCTFLSLMGLSMRAVLGTQPPEQHSYRSFGGPVFAVDSIAWWGMTETVSHGICSGGLPNPTEGSLGRPAPEYEIRVSDPSGAPVEPGQVGELFIRGIRGISMFAEYWNNPAATADAFDDEGWFSTGDLVRLNGDGTLAFVDRLKDMLKVGAENVAASEIERAVMTVPGIREVAIVGRPDPKLDQVPVAFVVPLDPDALEGDGGLPEAVRGACAGLLADFKVPREVYVVRALPRSTISKVNKADLRRFLAAGATGLDEAEAEWLRASVTDPSGDEG